MTSRLFMDKIGDARLNRALRNAELDRVNAEKMAEIARETETDTPALAVLSLLGDERQLRGIPAIGRGVAGAIAGTSPGL